VPALGGLSAMVGSSLQYIEVEDEVEEKKGQK